MRRSGGHAEPARDGEDVRSREPVTRQIHRLAVQQPVHRGRKSRSEVLPRVPQDGQRGVLVRFVSGSALYAMATAGRTGSGAGSTATSATAGCSISTLSKVTTGRRAASISAALVRSPCYCGEIRQLPAR